MTDTTLKIDLEGRNLLSVFMWGETGMYGSIISWNDLMPVVEKIESLEFSFDIVNNQANIISDRGDEKWLKEYPTKLESVYHVIVDFLRWYNEQQSIKQ